MAPTRRDFLLHAPILTGLVSSLRAADTEKPISPFLQGNFAPVREEVTLEKLPIVGKIPADLDGMFVRNGPNPQFSPLGNYHWFDGDGMLHGVRLRDGAASYRNRYIRTKGWQEERQAGKSLYTGLLEPPDLKKLFTGELPFKNAANTSLVVHAKKLLALWEGGDPHEVRVPDLETVGSYNFGGKLKHAFTAHPKIDPKTGEMLFFGYDVRKPYVRFSVVNAQGELIRTVPIDLPRPTMMHDFAITEHYAIFPDQPETFDLTRMAKGQSPWYFDDQSPIRFGLFPRTGDAKIRWFEAKSGYFFHSLNAFEKDDTVVLIACRFSRFPDDFQPAAVQGEANQKPNAPVLYRWTFDLKTGRTQESTIDDVSCEFPRFNESHMGRPIQFGYASEADGEFFGGLRKFDLHNGKFERHRFGKNRFGGEGVFVAKIDAKSEDDGYLITFVHDQNRNKSEMVIVDAKAFGEAPVARVQLPVRVPYGFHGTWVPGGMLG